MSRNVVSIAVAFALMVGGAMLASESSVKAGFGCGGYQGCGGQGHHGCGGGGLFGGHHRGHGCAGAAVQRGCGGGLFSRLHSRRQAACCAPQPVCCAPEPVCCAPEPACCAPQPACCDAAAVVEPGCGTEGMHGGPVVGDQYGAQQPVQQDAQVGAEAEVPSASDDAPVAPQADDASDVPPAPQPE